MSACISEFIEKNLPMFLNRYEISCCQEENCSEYFIFDKCTHEEISQSLILSLNIFSNTIHVNKFYPDLIKHPQSKYLSAVCFYLLIQHFAQAHSINEKYKIFLQTRPEVFRDFYEKLKDFHFIISRFDLGDTVNVQSEYLPFPINTSMISQEDIDYHNMSST